LLRFLPQGLKPIVLASFMYGLKPLLFIDSVFRGLLIPISYLFCAR
jgi:hypothetical protein